MSDKKKPLISAGEQRRQSFKSNLDDLTSKVMKKNRVDAAADLGVDYGWLRKACSVGLSRPDPRNTEPLGKVADRFHLAVDDLWTPDLLSQIWANGYLPEVRDHFVREFRFDHFVAHSEEFRQEIEELVEIGALRSRAVELPEDQFKKAADHGPLDTGEQLGFLLGTGRYDYLRSLIRDLYRAERSESG